MAAIVSVVVFGLAAVMLSAANHQSTASNNDRLRQQAVDVASAGLVVAASALTQNGAYSEGASPAADSASYKVTVSTVPGEPLRRVITSVGTSASSVRTMQQQVDLEPVEFTYGVFSEKDLEAGPTWAVTGNMYSNGSLILGQSASREYIGDIYAKGSIDAGKATITGSLNANLTVDVSKTKSVGGVYAGGTINSCSKVSGSCKPNLTPLPVPEQHLPTFTWNPGDYPGQTVFDNMTAATFSSMPRSAGVFHILGNIDLSNDLSLTKDMTIVADGNISMPKSVSKADPHGASVQLSVISTCSPTSPCVLGGGTGIIAAPNNFSFSVPVLVYTLGSFESTKKNTNSGVFMGVLYAGSIDSHANISITYAAVEAAGFNWAAANPQTFTIRHISTTEINS